MNASQALPYIAIEGCIGAGKSTVARELAEYLGFVAVLEDVDANPFLASLYRDPHGSRIQAMLTFLCIHYHQLYTCFNHVARCNGIVSDFFFPREQLFADTILHDEPEDDGRRIVLEVFQYFNRRLRLPDCVIYLRADTEFLVSRVMTRARDAESGISKDYINALNAAYDQFFAECKSVPVLYVEQSRLTGSPRGLAAEIAEELITHSILA